MKKYFFTVIIALASLFAGAQSRGFKIAYIDMEYILDKVPDYAEAKNQLEQKAAKWKQELEVKRNDINTLKQGLQAEKALLTKELIEEREEEIAYLEKDLLDYQEKRFGPAGDLISQKAVLVKPIQDQVFTIVQDLAEIRNYDFVFDKSSDLTMIFTAKKHDISDLIIKRLSRSAKREQLSSKELKKLEEQETQEELESNPDYAERQQKIEEKKNRRQQLLDERKAAQEEKKRAYEERRERLKQERDAKRAGNQPSASDTPAGDDNANRPAAGSTDRTATQGDETIQGENGKEVKTTATEKPTAGNAAAVERQNAAQAAKEERQRKIEERRQAIEDRKKQILEEREAAKKAREEKLEDKAPPANEETGE